MKRVKQEVNVLYLSMFVMGACGIAYEYTFSKVATDLLGNSSRQWAIIIGLMMFFMGLGSDLQRYTSDSRLMDKFIAMEVILGIAGGLGPIAFLYSFGKMPDHYIIVQYFFIILVGLLIGFEIPLLARINQRYTAQLKINIAGVLKMDYIGSFFGAVIWILVLTRYFTITQTAFVLAFFNLMVAAITYLYFRTSIFYKGWIAVMICLGMAIIVSGWINCGRWTSYAEQYLYRDKIIFSKTTPYQHLVITKDRSGDISFFINGNIQFSSFDEFIYHEHLVHTAFSISPVRKKVLVLGGGDGLAVREILKYKDVESVTLCDIDPEVVEAAKTIPELRELNKESLSDGRITALKNNALTKGEGIPLIEQNHRNRRWKNAGNVGKINIVHIDAGLFISQISGVYDIIIIDFPDPNSIELAKLYSKTFYENLRKKLRADGVIILQATSPVYSKEAFLCIGRTLKSSGLAAVPLHVNVPSFGEWGFFIVRRDDRSNKSDIKKKLMQVDNIPVPTRYITPELIHASLYFGKEQLKAEKKYINTIVNNKIYEYYLDGWSRFN